MFAGNLIKNIGISQQMLQLKTIIDINTVDSLYGTLEDIPYNIFCLKESEYVMKIMVTYSFLVEPDGQVKSSWKSRENEEKKTKTFKYNEPFDSHFCYQHAGDDQKIFVTHLHY